MVRRWSYLNSVNNIFFNQYQSLNFIHYEQSFKNNIVFRKEISYISSISRKSWSRRKHLTNWLLYQNVLTDWSREYTFFKKYNRFTAIFQMFTNSFLTYNTFLIKKLNASSSAGAEKIIFSSLTSKIIKYGSKYSLNFYLFLQNYKNMNWLYVTIPISNTSVLNQSTPLLTPIIYTSQGTFHQTYLNSNQLAWLSLIYQNLINIALSKLTNLYQITIILQLMNLKL